MSFKNYLFVTKTWQSMKTGSILTPSRSDLQELAKPSPIPGSQPSGLTMITLESRTLSLGTQASTEAGTDLGSHGTPLGA